MMASKSTPGLLKAMADYHAEHGSDQDHESTIDLLKRVQGDITTRGGKAEPSGYETIGKTEAKNAAERTMPGEANHDGGKGSVKTNEPGKADIPDEVADQHGGSGPLSGAGPVRSGGNILSAMAGPAAASGELGDIRRQAAIKELERAPSSEGNRDSNDASPFPPASQRVGDVKAPGGEPADKNKGSGFEGVPAFSKESLSGDGWSRARAKSKDMWAKAK